MYIWISISFLWYKAQQCVEQIAKDDMCFEVKNSNLTFCVFKNTGRFASISFISHYFLYYKKAAENWYVYIFIFRTILFKREFIDIYRSYGSVMRFTMPNLLRAIQIKNFAFVHNFWLFHLQVSVNFNERLCNVSRNRLLWKW